MDPERRPDLATTRRPLSCLALLALLLVSTPAAGQRVMDLVRVEGERRHNIMGYGLVGGLAGKGDSAKSPLAREMLIAALETLMDDPELAVPEEMVAKNVAAVFVTADISSDMKAGSKVTVRVSSIEDASSLEGGELYWTHLFADDGSGSGPHRFLARAQGPVVTAGRGARSGTCEAVLLEDIDIPPRVEKGRIRLHLDHPDLAAASEIVRAINAFPWLLRQAAEEMPIASVESAGTVRVRIPLTQQSEERLPDFISRILSEVQVRRPEPEARVVVQRSSGRVFISGQVRVAPVTVLTPQFELELRASGETRADGSPVHDLLIDVLKYLEQNEGVEQTDWAEIIQGLDRAGVLVGKLEVEE
jgi:flagellar P-ring protein precursor FlgI